MFHIINNKSGVFHIFVFINAGVIHEKPELQGLSHMMEHMFFKKTKHMSTEDILKASTKIGGVFNATTDKDCTTYYFKTNTANYDKAIKILAEMLIFPRFTPSDLEAERKVVFEELKKGLDNYEKMAWNLSTASVLDVEHEYARKVIGMEETLENISVRDLYNYYKQMYNGFMILVNCEKSVEADARKMVKDLFKTQINVHIPPWKSAYPDMEQKVIVVKKPLNQYNILLTFPVDIKYTLKTIVCTEFLSFVLTGAGLYSLLMYELREKHNMLYNIQSYNENMKYLSLFKIWMTTSFNDIQSILGLVYKILYKISSKGLKSRELRFFKQSFRNMLIMSYSEEDFKSTVTGTYMFNTDGRLLVTVKDMIRALNHIDNNDITRIASRLFDFAKVGVVVIGDVEANPEQYADKILSAINNKFIH